MLLTLGIIFLLIIIFYLRNFFKFNRKQKVLEVKKSKSIIVIGDDEADKREFLIRLFDQSGNGNKEEVISFENNIKLEKWLNDNLLTKRCP